MTTSAPVLQYVPYSSGVDVGFWHELTKNKLERYKLDDSEKSIRGTFVNNDPNGLSCRVNVDYNAFDETSFSSVPRTFQCAGTLILKNTIEDFKNLDKKSLLQNKMRKILHSIENDDVSANPSILNQFVLIMFADLKKYHFYYWFAFPALALKENIVAKEIRPITASFTNGEIVSIQVEYDQMKKVLGHDPFCFLLRRSGKKLMMAQLRDWDSFYGDENNVIVGFSDPSTLAEHPGWSLRNLLLYLALKKRSCISQLTILCYRDRIRDGKREVEHSLVIDIDDLPNISPNQEDLMVIGWEKNQRGKMGPRMVNLSATMDPVKLAESAVDLNLKLMRWRLMPEMQLEKIAATKCLLLGSGTLGCNVARSLLGWGVRTITFVDNSRVSYSNPVRQTLFQFEDCLDGGKKKAQAAAESLKRIFPGVNTYHYELSIPMPGHAIAAKDEMKIQEDVKMLENLIDDHDVVFLLMDTRESRWLPTVVANSKTKIVINAALGFDTFMVMRHGIRKKTDTPEKVTLNSETVQIPGNQLGCYFCNDVVAPGNSTQDRTLDQQCTVSRPGISMMASALAVELLVSLLHHPQGAEAPADTSANENHLQCELQSPIGIIPHQIRCFLSRFHTVLPATAAFDKCTGCSTKVIDAYEKDRFEFLLKVFNVPKYLEDMAGLTELHSSIVDAEIWELSDMEDDW